MKLLFETPVPQPVGVIKAGFTRELFQYLDPGFIPSELLRFDGCHPGNEVHIAIGVPGLRQKWISIITAEEETEQGWSFIDEGKVLPWPLKKWKHHHRVDKISASESSIVDDIQYECSPAFLTPLMKPFLWMVFAVRPSRYKKFFGA
jgi:ligand-binding SRPBCC domain-containing protein